MPLLGGPGGGAIVMYLGPYADVLNRLPRGKNARTMNRKNWEYEDGGVPCRAKIMQHVQQYYTTVVTTTNWYLCRTDYSRTRIHN